MQSLFRKLSAGSIVAMLSVSLLPVAYASSDVVLQSSYQRTTTINPGETDTFHAIVQNMTGTDRKVLIDLELYNQNNQMLAQKTYDNVDVAPYNIGDVTLESPDNLPAGSYIWKVGIFNPGWNGLLAWYENPLSFTVTGSQSMQSGNVVLSGSSLGEIHYNNCPVLTAILNNTSIQSKNVLIDFELRNSSGALVSQYFKEYMVPSALTRSPSFLMNQCDIQLPNGNYSYSVGVFNPGWNGLIGWYQNVQSFAVAL